MTKQVKNSKQMRCTLPENIQRELEEYWGEPITTIDYCGILPIEDRDSSLLHLPAFSVNGTYYVFLSGTKLFAIENIIQRQERQREFGKNVHRLMDNNGFSWKLNSAIISIYSRHYYCQGFSSDDFSSHIDRMVSGNDCEYSYFVECIQRAKKSTSLEYLGSQYWKDLFAKDPEETIDRIICFSGIDCWIDAYNSRFCNALKNYLFAIN